VAETPPVVVTVTSTVPVPVGDVAVIDVSEPAVMLAGLLPKSTAVAEPRPVPVMTTEVPPADGPDAGAMPVTVGAAT